MKVKQQKGKAQIQYTGKGHGFLLNMSLVWSDGHVQGLSQARKAHMKRFSLVQKLQAKPERGKYILLHV